MRVWCRLAISRKEEGNTLREAEYEERRPTLKYEWRRFLIRCSFPTCCDFGRMKRPQRGWANVLRTGHLQEQIGASVLS